MNAELERPFNEEEICRAVFQLGGLKAPGPDGYPCLFYHKDWDIIKEVILKSVWDFVASGFVLPILNRTHLVLLSKVPCPEDVGQFRPISLCNFAYKIISKVLANRLKPLLPSLVSSFQNAFVQGRQIQDNVLVAHEAYYRLKCLTKGKNWKMSLKVDMHKAYDRVEHDFLHAALLKFGFSPK